MERTDLLEILKHIDPSQLNYQEWVNVGMALKHEGYTASDWDFWSQNDPARYHAAECFKKWDTFQGAGTPVTGGTIVQLAKDQGWNFEPTESHALDWNDTIYRDELVIIDKDWIEDKEIVEPARWQPVQELIKYLETLFDSSDKVSYVTKCWEKDGKYMPSKGVSDRTAGQLIELLNKCQGDIGSVLGDYNEIAGAWIRFNPMDGKGIKDENVVSFKYALIESDDLELEKQNAIIRELELPVACLVYSGKKSIHAIVKIEAINHSEYVNRVDYLYKVCKKNGLKIDTANKNPSRLSRMPGVMRNGKKQFLMDTNIGKESWNEWQEWIESVNDDLPEPESLNEYWNDLPALAPSLIDGVLRQGHKLLIAGPSKAGKSFALIEMCIAIAEGKKWFNWPCAKGKVLYVNLELDRASCLHRFKDVYTSLEWPAESLQNIDIWNLRGKSIPMDKLAPKLIRRAAKKNYIAIVIDPIYKVITGDENSADQMANFCNQFDKVCTELGCAVIYCHHHSKGSQGSKRSMDRASGSGVFARDPDALLDLIELEISEDLIKQESNKAVCRLCMDWLRRYGKTDLVSQDDECSETQMLAICRINLKEVYESIIEEVAEVRKKVEAMTAWRIEGTLREFPKFAPINLWFDYPVHRVDRVGTLKDIQLDDTNYRSKKKNTSVPVEDKQMKKQAELESAFTFCDSAETGEVSISNLIAHIGKSRNYVKDLIDANPKYERDRKGMVRKVSKCQKT